MHLQRVYFTEVVPEQGVSLVESKTQFYFWFQIDEIYKFKLFAVKSGQKYFKKDVI